MKQPVKLDHTWDVQILQILSGLQTTFMIFERNLDIQVFLMHKSFQ